MASKAAEKNLELACLMDEQVPWIIGNITKLRQILVNVLGNAVKFTEEDDVVACGSLCCGSR